MVVQKNGNANLKCIATGNPTPTISWLHNGVTVPTDENDPENRRYQMPKGDLTFIRVVHNRRRSDSGIYQCVATNRHGIVYSRNATLQVGGMCFVLFLCHNNHNYDSNVLTLPVNLANMKSIGFGLKNLPYCLLFLGLEGFIMNVT